MNDGDAIRIPYERTRDLLAALEALPDGILDLDGERERIRWRHDDGARLDVALPWTFPPLGAPPTLHAYLNGVLDFPPATLVLLIQAGHAALGLSEAGELLEHKVIRKYMTRRKQGKAQITHLKTKGKSRLGSRIRLQQSVEFVEEINRRGGEWIEDHPVERILVSCSETLWGLLFQSRVPAPFERRDPRLRFLPVHVHTPNMAELERIIALSLDGEVRVSGSLPDDIRHRFPELSPGRPRSPR